MKSLALITALSFPLAQQTEQQAWDAANALRQKAAYVEAARAFEALRANFPNSARATHALVEAGVSWFNAGQAAQKLRRNTPESDERFKQGLALFDRVLAEYPNDPVAARAAHMRGSTFLFRGQLEDAERAYSSVLESYPLDPRYLEKALSFRGNTRRHLLRPASAIADYERFVREFPASKEFDSVMKTLELARTVDKPAPLYAPEQWVTGEPMPLETLGGHVVALYFWATWCPNCAKQEPRTLDMIKRYAGRDVQFIGVTNHQRGQTAATIKQHATRQGYTFPIFQDDGATSQAYKVTAIPHLALIDRDGLLRWSDNPDGFQDWTLEALLRGEAK